MVKGACVRVTFNGKEASSAEWKGRAVTRLKRERKKAVAPTAPLDQGSLG